MAKNEKFRGLTNPPLQSSRILPNLIKPCNRCTLKKLFLNLFLRKVMVSQNPFVDKVLVTENNSKHKVVYNVGITLRCRGEAARKSTCFAQRVTADLPRPYDAIQISDCCKGTF